VAALVVWAGRRWELTKGRAFALYVAGYCAGRVWIEALRVDEAERIFGLRLNDYVAGALLLAALAYLWLRRDRSAQAPDAPAKPDVPAQPDVPSGP